MIQFPLNVGPAPCVNMPLCKPARGLGIGKLRHMGCSQHPRTAPNPTGVCVWGRMEPHQFMQKVTLGTGLGRQSPWDLLPSSSRLRRTSTFQRSAICPAASPCALNPTGNLFPFNGFTVKQKVPGHKSSLGLEGMRIIVAIKRKALSLNIPMHSLFFSQFFQQL